MDYVHNSNLSPSNQVYFKPIPVGPLRKSDKMLQLGCDEVNWGENVFVLMLWILSVCALFLDGPALSALFLQYFKLSFFSLFPVSTIIIIIMVLTYCFLISITTPFFTPTSTHSKTILDLDMP